MTVPRGFTRCDECEGKGRFERSNGSALTPPSWPVPARCHVCSGSGLLPTEKLREEAARSIAAFHRPSRPDFEFETFEEVYRREADAVLRKVAEHIGEDR